MKQKEIVKRIMKTMLNPPKNVSSEKLTIQQLSFRSQVSQPQLHRILKQGQSTNFDTMVAIAESIGLEIVVVTKEYANQVINSNTSSNH